MFSFEDFDIKLNTEYVGRNFTYCEEIASTNQAILDPEFGVKDNGALLLAEFQTKGKGRKDRTWISSKGDNLTFSILITDKNLLKNKLNFVNLGAALAVSNSISNLFMINCNLKWPNDVLINGKKISGILMESVSQGPKMNKAAVGIGININQTFFDGSFAINPTALCIEVGSKIERERFLAELLNEFEEILEKVKLDPKLILKDWRNKCKMIGDNISVVEGENTKYGVFYDIDDNGFLVLRTREGLETIHFGDVSVR